jgi:5-(carboxyamino)imidazole ribonucleotide synthase
MRVAIVGCGQLARMMALAGWNMGLEFTFLAEPGEATRSVEGLGRIARRDPDDTPAQLYAALGEPDVITVEKEHVDTGMLRALSEFCPVHPDPDAVHACQDRLREKLLCETLELATAPYRVAKNALDVTYAVESLGLPLVVKARREGYDGKQQWRIRSTAELRDFCIDNRSGDWLVESQINFQREVSVLAARSANGDIAIYPPTENRHQGGILLTSIAPAENLPDGIMADCQRYIRALLEKLDYVGVLAMECFVCEEGLLVNELAPRVHNSGHWTMRSEATSQFENHLRAILGMNLGSTSVTRYEGMLNILGSYDRGSALRLLSRDSTLTDYNKSSAPRRKLGHINVSRESRTAMLEELSRLSQCLYVDRERAEYPGWSIAS